jgi:hypothetical protein
MQWSEQGRTNNLKRLKKYMIADFLNELCGKTKNSNAGHGRRFKERCFSKCAQKRTAMELPQFGFSLICVETRASVGDLSGTDVIDCNMIVAMHNAFLVLITSSRLDVLGLLCSPGSMLPLVSSFFAGGGQDAVQEIRGKVRHIIDLKNEAGIAWDSMGNCKSFLLSRFLCQDGLGYHCAGLCPVS